MKLQLWTTVSGDPDELISQIDVDLDTWADAQSSPADALAMVQDLASSSD